MVKKKIKISDESNSTINTCYLNSDVFSELSESNAFNGKDCSSNNTAN